jgi:hypothetical protein
MTCAAAAFIVIAAAACYSACYHSRTGSNCNYLSLFHIVLQSFQIKIKPRLLLI